MAAADYFPLVQELYISYFGRPADPRGLANFAAQLDALHAPTTATALNAAVHTNAGIQALVNSFSTSDESKALYNNTDTLSFVGQIYKNVLNRVGDADGMIWWSNEIDAGHLSRADAALAIMAGALENTTTQGLVDAKLVNAKVAIAGNFTAAIDTGDELLAYVGNDAAATARNMLATVTADTDPVAFQSTVDSTLVDLISGATAGQSFDLKTGVDHLTGTNGNDTFNAVIDGVNTTLTGLDNINGGLGNNDTLNIADVTGNSTMPGGITLTGIETINVSSTAGAGSVGTAFDVSGQAGVTALNVVISEGFDNIKAGSGQAVSVNNTAGSVTIVGGSSQTVNTAGGVTLTKATGAITVTDADQGVANSSINGGTNVTVTSTSALDSATDGTNKGSITIGNTAAASGNVTVTTNVAGDAAADSVAGDIAITGGKTVTVTQNGTQDLDSDGTANVLTQSAVNVTGSAATTSVTVKQAVATDATDAVDEVANVNEVGTVKFSALKVGEQVTIDGLTFTASKALTAAQAAAAFANLTAGSLQGGAPTGNGIYSGTFGGNWSSGAVATDTVTFTSTNEGVLVTHLSAIATGTATATATTTVNGVDAVDAEEGAGGVIAGVVSIADKAYGTGTNTITTVSLDSYGNNSIVQSDALTKLSLANVIATNLNVDNHTATALDLTLNGVTKTAVSAASSLNLDHVAATYTSLAVHTTGAGSAVNVTGAAVTGLTVDGSAAVTLTGSTFSALKTVTISGAASVTAGTAFGGSTVTDVNASATSGKVSATIDASKATFEGGSGNDTVTISGAVSKAISLGAGDDVINLAAGTTSLTAKIDAGTGTDTLGMAAADAAAASGNTLFIGNAVGFEKLSLGLSTAANTVDLANLGNINYVISANTGASAVVGATALGIVKTEGVAATTTESDNITFFGLTAGQSYTVAGRTVTATGTASAADVAAAFSSGVNTATLAVTGVLADWTAAAPSGGGLDHVVFTSTTANTNVTDIATSASAGGVSTLTLKNMADAGTLELNAAGNGVVVTMKDATGTADSFNIVTKLSTANLDYGTVSVAGVETVNVNVNDTSLTAGVQTATLTVKDAAAKSLVLSGNANLHLILDATDLAVTSIDGSAAAGKLEIATLSTSTAAVTVKGGAGADLLTANHISDVLNGGAGNDVLVVNADLVSMTGGAGADTFNVAHATTNVNAYSTIVDLGTGDAIKFAASAATFNSSKVALGDTAVFQDYANAAINQSHNGDLTWFQMGGNTYVVENVSGGDHSTFTNGSDVIVKITGTVDLSTASFNSTTDTLLIA